MSSKEFDECPEAFCLGVGRSQVRAKQFAVLSEPMKVDRWPSRHSVKHVWRFDRQSVVGHCSAFGGQRGKILLLIEVGSRLSVHRTDAHLTRCALTAAT